jgi:RNA polymerase sigma-70 factor, ECF subfamily
VEDAALISGTLAGHKEDFEVLVERYQRRLYAFATRVLRDPETANDVVQATFVRAYTSLKSFRGDAGFCTWLHQIALNECRNRLRAQSARKMVPLDEAPEAALARSDAPAEGLRALVGQLVEKLPPRQRTVLSLRLFSDLPFREIARCENISENAAKVNYHYAVKRLRQWLTEARAT